MPTPELLDKLLRAAGPSGNETAPANATQPSASTAANTAGAAQ